MSALRDRILSLLRLHDIRLNTNLGQHFLVDEEILEKIVQSGDIQPTDHIVEIGPGIGVLTSELLKRAAHVTVIELDDRFIPLLKKYVQIHAEEIPSSHLSTIHQNALQTPFPIAPYKIIANIPYHITSPLLRHAYLESPTRPTAMTLLIQREVAEKICDEDHAGILTIIVKLFGNPRLICTVVPDAFVPPPAVNSAVLHITSHAEPLADPTTIESILRLLKIGFAGKRKMLRNTLGQMENGMALLEKAGIDPTRRPEHLKVEEWIALVRG